MSDYEDDDNDYEIDIDDNDDNDIEDDPLLNEGVGENIKQNTKEEDSEEKEGEENPQEEDEEETEIESVKYDTKPKYRSGHSVLQFFEYTRVLTILAEEISKSSILVPKEHETLLNVASGDSILIAMRWIRYKDIVPLPIFLFRKSEGFVPEKVDVNRLVTHEQLSFSDLDQEQIEKDAFDTCFRLNGY